ncbi:unnamed protein product [Linum tenue]|nr:unnamed protein product [Linum tenue]
MDYHKLVRTFLVCNPFTKQWVALPLAPPRPIGGRVSIARLVCRPSSSVVTLDAGDVSKPALTHHFEYEFRVVRMSRFKSSVSELDVFCSKSGEWTMVALDLGGRLTPRWGLANTVVSLNGKLYWMNTGSQVIRWNPFSLEVEEEEDHDALRIPRGVSDSEIEFCLCVSQGDLCLFFIDGVTFESPRDVLSVWRQGYGRRGWRRYHQVALNKLMSRIVYDQHGREIRRFELEFSNVVGQHPEKSEIVLVEFLYPNGQIGVYSCNLRTKELKFLFEQKDYFQGHMVFQPKVSLWPTQFSNYEKLRGCYDGSYSGWVQSSNQSTS